MLSYDTVQQIGGLLCMSYTVFNGRSEYSDGESDGETTTAGCARFVESNGTMPPLLIFTSLVTGFLYADYGTNNTKSIYVLNLKTLKPTKNSYRQIELPSKLKNLIRNELNGYH